MVFDFLRKKLPVPPVSVSTDEEHDLAYSQGFSLIDPYMQIHNTRSKDPSSHRAIEETRVGIGFMQVAWKYQPNAYAHHWIMGKAHQAIGQHQAAYESFKRPHQLQPDHHVNASVAGLNSE